MPAGMDPVRSFAAMDSCSRESRSASDSGMLPLRPFYREVEPPEVLEVAESRWYASAELVIAEMHYY